MKYTVHHLTCDYPRCPADVERPKPKGVVGWPEGWIEVNKRQYCPRHASDARRP